MLYGSTDYTLYNMIHLYIKSSDTHIYLYIVSAYNVIWGIWSKNLYAIKTVY